MEENVLATHSVRKAYGNAEILSGVTMTVPRGSIYGFVGKNGAEKTTLMRVIAGLQAPTSGRYELFGAGFLSPQIAAERKRIGAVGKSRRSRDI